MCSHDFVFLWGAVQKNKSLSNNPFALNHFSLFLQLWGNEILQRMVNQPLPDSICPLVISSSLAVWGECNTQIHISSPAFPPKTGSCL